MFRKLALAVALTLGALIAAAAPASAMRIDTAPAAAAAGQTNVLDVRWVCGYGGCVWRPNYYRPRYYAPPRRYYAPRRYYRQRCGWVYGHYGRRWRCW